MRRKLGKLCFRDKNLKKAWKTLIASCKFETSFFQNNRFNFPLNFLEGSYMGASILNKFFL